MPLLLQENSPELKRDLDGGLPPLPADAAGPFYPKRAVKLVNPFVKAAPTAQEKGAEDKKGH